MVSQKLYNGVAHDIAHHAASQLSWLHPHLGDVCRATGFGDIKLDLLSLSYSDAIPLSDPLEKATTKLNQTFLSMITKFNLDVSNVKRAELKFVFFDGKDNYYCQVESAFELQTGQIYSHVIKPVE